VAQTTAFVSKGRIAALDSPSNLIRSVTDRVRVNVTVRAAEGVETTLRGLAQLVHRDAALGTFELSVKETDVPEALERIARHGLASVRIEQPGLEEAYAKLAGESLHPVEKP
jgi:ABC-type multidrug transport system ATPase subunit